MADFDTFLKDHASCEKKASGMALAIASHYPDRPALVSAMADLAVEELSHYREVVRILIDRGLSPGPDVRDPYVRSLNATIRQGTNAYLLDRLLIAGIVERRGHERFGLVAKALGSDPLAAFYHAITASEGRHSTLFFELAGLYFEDRLIAVRLDELVEQEAAIMRKQPAAPTLH